MKDGSKSVKPFEYASRERIQAQVRYLLAIRGLRQDGLHRLLAFTPSQSMISRVCNGQKRSANLEVKIATVLGVTREELFGTKGLKQLWRVA
jgi:transcriptional regulator with XRE-family HTH domain